MIYTEDEYLMLSGIQHFYFCKKQWALIHISQEWKENADTMMGTVIHKKTDEPHIKEKRKGIFYSRAIPVASSKLGLTGILDTVEFISDPGGIEIAKRRGKWKPYIVEYKKGKKKSDNRDIVQLVAQVICLEEKYHCKIEHSYLYYHSTKKREKVEISQELKDEVYSLCLQMHKLYKNRKLPAAEYSSKCNKCSLYDVCMPNLKISKGQISKYIKDMSIL